MNTLRMYVRSVLSEAVGQITYQRTDVGRAADKFTAGDILTQGTGFFKDAASGIVALKNAGSIMARSKTGKVAAGWSATKGSRKNVLKAASAVGVIAYTVSGAYASKRNEDTTADPTARDEELQKQLAKFHDEVLDALDNKQTSLLNAYTTPEMRATNPDTVSEEDAKTFFTNYSANYNKYVKAYTSAGSMPLAGRFSNMLESTSEGVNVRATIAALAARYAAESKGDFDEEGLKYYASCLMQIYEAQLLAGAMKIDLDKIPENFQARVDYGKFVTAKKAEIDKTKALIEAVNVTQGME